MENIRSADTGGSDHSAGAPPDVSDSVRPRAAQTSTVELFGRVFPWRTAVAAVLGLAAVMFFARLGVRALWSSEFRWAEIAREMQLNSHYFWPTINGRVYYDKPLGSYWLVVAAAQLTGGIVNETSARLPCAIAGLLAIWLLLILGRRLYDNRTALLAGVVLITSYSFLFFSRTASADVETITGELAALALFLRYEREQNGWWVVWLWIVMAATSLTKGLLGFVLPLMVIGVYSCLADGWAELWHRISHGAIGRRVLWLFERNRWLFNWKSVIAIALGGVIYYVPFAISAARTGSEKGLDMVYRENVVRFFHPFDHRGPIYLYVYVIFALMLPWSIFLPAALAQAHSKDGDAGTAPRSNRFTLVYFWATFIFFTLSGSRRSYYLLPILPAGALLVARMLTTPMESLAPLARRFLKIGYAVAAVGLIGSVIVMVPPSWILPGRLAGLPAAPDRAIFAFCWLVSTLAVIYTLRNFDSRRIAMSTGIAAVLFLGYVFIFAMPAADRWRGEKPFAHTIREKMGQTTTGIALYKAEGPIFYLNLPHPVPYYQNVARLRHDALADKVHWVIVRRRDVGNFEKKIGIPSAIVAREAFFPFEPRQHILNKNVLIELGKTSRDKAHPASSAATKKTDPG